MQVLVPEKIGDELSLGDSSQLSRRMRHQIFLPICLRNPGKTIPRPTGDLAGFW
jgi:hypothetical protein